MIDTCPPDGELERLLASGRGAAEGQALETHVAGCPACQRRLGALNRGGLTLPSWPASLESIPQHVATLEQTINFIPSAAPATAQQHAPGRGTEVTSRPTPTPTSAGATTPPAERRDTASPSLAQGLDKPTGPQPTTPEPAGDPPTAPVMPDASPGPPAFFGRYQVRSALGAGGFGTVYLGHDSQRDRPVAIKAGNRGGIVGTVYPSGSSPYRW